MRALVTGGAGFIGSNLAHRLRDQGWQVKVLDNFSSGYRQNVPDGVELLVGDVRDEKTVNEAMRQVTQVFHLAASVGNQRSMENPVADSMTNVIGTLHVLEAARRHHVEKVVVSSSAGIFGELKTLPIAEDHPAEPDSPYGASKLAAEKHALACAKLHGLDVTCLRYFNVYGRNQRFDPYGNVIPIFATRALRGEPLIVFGDGEQTRDFVHVDDVVAANLSAGPGRGKGAVFNLGSGTRISINALARLVLDLRGGRGSIEHGPGRKGDVLHSMADITAAHGALGWVPRVDLEVGLRAYLDWLEGDMGRVA